jgi:hypothetical protein
LAASAAFSICNFQWQIFNLQLLVFQMAAARVGLVHEPPSTAFHGGIAAARFASDAGCFSSFILPPSSFPSKEKINAVKRLAVSTGQLRRLTRLTHPAYRPGRLPGAFARKVRETSSCGGFHAYMPSAFILAVR